MVSPNRRRAVAMLVCVATLATVAACGGGEEEVGDPKLASAVSTTTTTTIPVPQGPFAPLTGLQLPPGSEAFLARPALAVKYDNAAQARPQVGIDAADIVFELRVEGISRFIGVFHSNDVAELGPIRSARESDPAFLEMFNRPLAAWSGSNPGVAEIMYDADVVNVNWDSVERTEYFRQPGRSAPHNLFSTGAALRSHTPEGAGPPPAVFSYRPPGAMPAGAAPAWGVAIDFGDVVAGWRYDAGLARWLRSEYDGPHMAGSGARISATNVVVLDTQYERSSVDTASPKAEPFGSGVARVFVEGAVIEGTWQRADSRSPYTLVDTLGQPIQLVPGPTWVELPNGGSTTLLSQEAAAALG